MSDLDLFVSIGLSEAKAKETLKNKNLTSNLKSVINEFPKTDQPLTNYGTLLYHLASKLKSQDSKYVGLIDSYIFENKLDTPQRIDCCLDYLRSLISENIDLLELDKACGVGIVITIEEIKQTVEEILSQNKNELLEKRYKYNIGGLMQEVRKKLVWADGKVIKNEVDNQILNILGAKTEADLAPVQKQKKIKEIKPIEKKTLAYQPLSIEEIMSKVDFHKPGENFKTDGYVITKNTEMLLAQHLKETSGKVITRFPPEPNGILHIGHAKAININFGFAKASNGECILRYDDTNPEKEEEKYFTGIKEMVEWLGYKPHRITHSSDYFDKLYNWAIALTKKGLAYVCHQRQQDMQGFNPPPSPWRNRPIEENLSLLNDMKNGIFDEGEATLRMKVTLEEGKQDPVAYRIKFLPHHRSKDKWCIYPTYDYTHCLCDSIENITHSLCTKEFQNRRSTYYWLCNSLDLYCPVQWEYGRLNMNYTVVSKRKISKLIENKIVNDWDDPRLFTLSALRRRGFPAKSINSFCARMGVTGAQAIVDPQMLESEVQDYLNLTASRTMVALEPLKIIITNFDELNKPYSLSVPDFPNDPDKGWHDVKFSSILYIESNDFSQNADKDYRRLTIDQTVGLRYAGIVIKAIKVVTVGTTIKEIHVEATDVKTAPKPKAFIHWVSNPVEIEVRLYDRLFMHKNPEDINLVPNGYLSDINSDSLKIVNAYADVHILKSPVLKNYQFERLGYFCVDLDSNDTKLVFNRTITLKDSSSK
ncbi:probable glutamine--tRNA ligase [Melanaphis sacchari]|uniref:glutamine--tRNA ligase n=1 Tax=Melanaphis sacchari TaxID=742174 RepID=A0A2H8TQC3_9HEMI|nr:probable glutamine--tRNA ligase [Melanaphis sacchari]XP_025194609.1 probable glutamine--tRNA ligase [Melanaphis sacchari]